MRPRRSCGSWRAVETWRFSSIERASICMSIYPSLWSIKTLNTSVRSDKPNFSFCPSDPLSILPLFKMSGRHSVILLFTSRSRCMHICTFSISLLDIRNDDMHLSHWIRTPPEKAISSPALMITAISRNTVASPAPRTLQPRGRIAVKISSVLDEEIKVRCLGGLWGSSGRAQTLWKI